MEEEKKAKEEQERVQHEVKTTVFTSGFTNKLFALVQLLAGQATVYPLQIRQYFVVLMKISPKTTKYSPVKVCCQLAILLFTVSYSLPYTGVHCLLLLFPCLPLQNILAGLLNSSSL